MSRFSLRGSRLRSVLTAEPAPLRVPIQRLKPPLSPPVDADETLLRMRAQSLLSGTKFFDGTTSCPPLTLAQARDVLAWYCPRTP